MPDPDGGGDDNGRGGYGHETENENLKPGDGPPRPATEPGGAGGSTQSPKTRTDPATGVPTGEEPEHGG